LRDNHAFTSKFKDTEFTQCLVSFEVNLSPSNTCPKCPPQEAQTISTLLPSLSGTLFTASVILSSKLGHPQPDLNLEFES